MEIYDISQEVFSSEVYPGDPSPQALPVARIAEGEECNVSAFSMCAHNGTHMDAPYHFFECGKPLDEIPLDTVIGEAFVAEHVGKVEAHDALRILERASNAGGGCEKRILIKGSAVVGEEAARVFAEAGVLLLGNESQSVGPEDIPMNVHRILLGAGVVLLEGVRLEEVPEGRYTLNAAPLKLAGLDGAPCRAVLIG